MMANNFKIRNKDLKDSGIEAYNILLLELLESNSELCKESEGDIDINKYDFPPEDIILGSKINIKTIKL